MGMGKVRVDSIIFVRKKTINNKSYYFHTDSGI